MSEVGLQILPRVVLRTPMDGTILCRGEVSGVLPADEVHREPSCLAEITAFVRLLFARRILRLLQRHQLCALQLFLHVPLQDAAYHRSGSQRTKQTVSLLPSELMLTRLSPFSLPLLPFPIQLSSQTASLCLPSVYSLHRIGLLPFLRMSYIDTMPS